MPSLMDVDGHSGWGVRLCNVKLREGVELMTLPGKRRVKKKKKRRKKKTKKAATASETSQTTAGRASKKSDNNRNGASPFNDDTTTTRDEQTNTAAHGENGVSDYEKLRSSSGNNNQTATTPIRSRMMTEDDTDMESALSSRVPSPSIMCRTSVASVVTGCLSRGGHGATVEATTDDEDDEVLTPSSPPSRGGPFRRDSLVKQNVVFDTQALEGVVVDGVEPTKMFRPIDPDEEDKEDEEIKAETVVETVDDAEEDEEDEEDEGEDEYYFIEEDMILCLGKAGRIGTLDVRLIGKDLHVMVEDAFLTIEACPKPEESDDASVRTASTADTTKDDATKAKKKEKKKPAKPAATKEGQTVGERVIEKSMLAKAISAIPHLLLRDVRVQFIVRNKAQESEGEVHAEVGPEDSVVELGIEMLSVTSGEDFLENFGNDDGKADDMEDSATSYTSRKRVSLQVLEERDENEYLMKRIRTGKGPEGGISIKVFPPDINRRIIASRVEERQDWAFQSYYSSAQFCLLRCSGLDIRTRIYLGKQKEVALRNNDYAWYGDEYDEYTIDSMLFGVDYIAPASPPLPPLERQDSIHIEQVIKPEVERFVTDENSIQSNTVRSCFHKVARGLTPTLCQKDHLPSDYCTYCWENSARPNSYSEHPLDARTPLPGIVFQLSLHEPLEINVDRQSLELIGSLQELFGASFEEPAEDDSEEMEKEKKTREDFNHAKAEEYDNLCKEGEKVRVLEEFLSFVHET